MFLFIAGSCNRWRSLSAQLLKLENSHIQVFNHSQHLLSIINDLAGRSGRLYRPYVSIVWWITVKNVDSQADLWSGLGAWTLGWRVMSRLARCLSVTNLQKLSRVSNRVRSNFTQCSFQRHCVQTGIRLLWMDPLYLDTVTYIEFA